MKILFITQEDPFYIKIFFEKFLENFKDKEEIKGVVICRTMGKSFKKLITQMYNFYGPLDFVRMGFRYVRNKILANCLGMTKYKKFYDLKQVLKFYNIPVIRCSNINNGDFISSLRNMEIDLIISVAAPQIFKEQILSLPKLGCINIHNAKLPSYRGMLPNFWNMYNDEKYSAITIHTMDNKIDQGKIILQKEFEIEPGESLDSLIKRTKAIGALYMIDAIEKLRKGWIEFQAVPDVPPSYYSFPSREDVRVFRKKGKRLL